MVECLWGHPAEGQVAEALGYIHFLCFPREAKVSQFQVLANSHQDIPARQVPVQDTQSSQELLYSHRVKDIGYLMRNKVMQDRALGR